MLPSQLIGTVVLKGGEQRPFVLHTASGRVELGAQASADPQQARLGRAERKNIERHVTENAGAPVERVRLGELCCSACGSWIDVAAKPELWSRGSCSSCSPGRGSDAAQR